MVRVMGRFISRSQRVVWVLVVMGWCGCTQGPLEAYSRTLTCAHEGNQQCFLQGFTQDSRDLVGALVSMTEAYGMREANPHRLLFHDSVQSIDITGDKALITVMAASSQRVIPMIREGDNWCIDALQMHVICGSEGEPCTP